MATNPRNGMPVDGVTVNDFTLREDGEPQTITYFSRDELPLSIILMFDLTDTVRPVLKPLAAGAAALLSRLKAQDEIAVMTFSSTAQLVEGFCTDRQRIVAAIERASGMKSKEATFLNPTVFRVVEVANSSLPGTRRAIICLADGTVNVPSDATLRRYGKGVRDGKLHTEEEAMKTLVENGSSFNAVIERPGLSYLNIFAGAADPTGPILKKRYPWGDVHKYAEKTGGVTVGMSKSELNQKLAALLDTIRSRYTIGYRPARDAAAGTFCRIEVGLTPEASKRLGNVQIRAKAGYYR
jgi:Ca-activated chloride channel family protein